MGGNQEERMEIYEGLRALQADSFPKRCRCCGVVYESEKDFIRRTRRLFRNSGLCGETRGENLFVHLYRNCRCGSTLLEFFQNRRDQTEAGLVRREKFQRILDQLTSMGWDEAIAREEVQKILQGERSSLLEIFLTRSIL